MLTLEKSVAKVQWQQTFRNLISQATYKVLAFGIWHRTAGRYTKGKGVDERRAPKFSSFPLCPAGAKVSGLLPSCQAKHALWVCSSEDLAVPMRNPTSFLQGKMTCPGSPCCSAKLGKAVPFSTDRYGIWLPGGLSRCLKQLLTLPPNLIGTQLGRKCHKNQKTNSEWIFFSCFLKPKLLSTANKILLDLSVLPLHQYPQESLHQWHHEILKYFTEDPVQLCQ